MRRNVWFNLIQPFTSPSALLIFREQSFTFFMANKYDEGRNFTILIWFDFFLRFAFRFNNKNLSKGSENENSIVKNTKHRDLRTRLLNDSFFYAKSTICLKYVIVHPAKGFFWSLLFQWKVKSENFNLEGIFKSSFIA